MKPRIFLSRRSDGSYIPYNEDSRELINKLKDRDIIEGKFTNSRLPWFHKRFFLALGFIYDNMPENFKEIYPTSEKLRKDLLKLAGHYEVVKSIDGTERKEVLSMDLQRLNRMSLKSFILLLLTCL
jgi:hypothetical protein